MKRLQVGVMAATTTLMGCNATSARSGQATDAGAQYQDSRSQPPRDSAGGSEAQPSFDFPSSVPPPATAQSTPCLLPDEILLTAAGITVPLDVECGYHNGSFVYDDPDDADLDMLLACFQTALRIPVSVRFSILDWGIDTPIGGKTTYIATATGAMFELLETTWFGTEGAKHFILWRCRDIRIEQNSVRCVQQGPLYECRE